ncbi:MAG TPA: AMP-binding protein [Thermoanaerobaculia bacterium]
MDAAPMIDWESLETHLLLNPRLPDVDRTMLERLAAETPLERHVWLATSGTTGSLKLVALSKDALLVSAAAVNRHLDSSSRDVWACVLPGFHVGGLGIHARAFLSGARVVATSWDPERFLRLCAEEGVTLSSLVPAQVADLVKTGRQAPSSLRAVVVGGGALPEAFYRAGLKAGWPLLPSYGMTECSSQVATARPGSSDLVVLDHVELAIGDDGRIRVRGESLLTGVATVPAGFDDPKVDGWFVSEDLGAVAGGILRVGGRSAEFVKVGGESVDLSRLQRILEEETDADAAVVALPDQRLGHAIGLAVAAGDGAGAVAKFNRRVLPFERARTIVDVREIPRSELGKILRGELSRLVEEAWRGDPDPRLE